MHESADHELLAQYARHNSEEAYALLVERHLNLVYSAALRQVADSHKAEEITQAVFLILAQKAGSLSPKVILVGWLYRTTRLTAANYLRQEKRQRDREQEAYMQSLAHEPAPDTWNQIAPWLDTAMEQLGSKDRDAVLLRFFEGRSLREVGTALYTNEDTAQKRVDRALKKLRNFFTKRGITLSAATLMALLSSQSAHAAPAGLAGTVTATSLAKGATASGLVLLLTKSTMKIMSWLKIKTVLMAGASALLVASATTALVEVALPGAPSGSEQHKKPPVLTGYVLPSAGTPPPNTNAFLNTGSLSFAPPGNNPGSTQMSDAEAKQKGIAAIVNQKIIFWSDIDNQGAEAQRLLLQNYKGDELNQRLTKHRQTALRALIERELMIESFQATEPPIPDAAVNERIDDIVKTQYGGNRDDFLKTLEAGGSSLEKCKGQIIDNAAVSYMRDKHVIKKADDYFAQNPQLLTGDAQNRQFVRYKECMKIEKEWLDGLTSQASIQIFDDPGPPENFATNPGPNPDAQLAATVDHQQTSYPLGISIPDKPGFVKSPYAEYAEPIDVHAYPSGAAVRCPYTNKLFTVPPAPESK